MGLVILDSSRLAGGEHSQAHITADQQFAQRLRIDQPVAPLIIAETEIGLCFHTVERRLAANTFTSRGGIKHIAIFSRAETTISAMSIKVNGITGGRYASLIQGTHPPVGTQIAYQAVICRGLQAIDGYQSSLSQGSETSRERFKTAFCFQRG